MLIIQKGNFQLKIARYTAFLKNYFIIITSQTNAAWSVTQLQIHDWPSDGQMRQPHTVTQVINDVIKAQQTNGGGPVVVHCRYIIYTTDTTVIILLYTSDSVSRSGVYCAVSNAIEQCKTEGIVDVFQAVKAIRIHRPGAVVTLVSEYLTTHWDEFMLVYYGNKVYM